MTREELKAAAVSILDRAYCPYSRFPVGAALECEEGTVYTGCNVENAAYPAGICAERNAIFHMLTQGESQLQRVLALMPDGRVGPPCGACRELMAQLMPKTYGDIEILLDYEAEKVAPLSALTPEWWI